MPTTHAIATFLDGYELGEWRPLTPDERSLLEEALADFLVHELSAAAAAVADYAARLCRREHANTIMREELAILSDRRSAAPLADNAACPPDHPRSSP